MKKALVLGRDDIKKILAEKFGVGVDKIIVSQYSYVVQQEDVEGDEE